MEFAVLNVLQFDATRKRMSIIVQHPLSKEIILFVKGADSAILSVLHKKYKGLLGFGCGWFFFLLFFFFLLWKRVDE